MVQLMEKYNNKIRSWKYPNNGDNYKNQKGKDMNN
jgi:hypothetical protein